MSVEYELDLANISKSFTVEKQPLKAIEDINLKIKKGELSSIIGPNGCGKSTLIKIVAGVDKPTSGVYKSRGDVAYLPQQDSLMPWLTVRENIELPGKIQKITNHEIQSRIKYYLKKYKLDKFSEFYPGEISGGMKQKVALIRTVVYRPRTIILDEPFSALDAITRIEMQQMLIDLWEEYKPTVLCVTHDIEEAIFLSDRIFVMSKHPGRIIKAFNVNNIQPRDLNITSMPPSIKLKKNLRELLLS